MEEALSLEIALQTATTLTITTTPQMIVPSRGGTTSFYRGYLSLVNKDLTNTVMIASDVEHNAPNFNTAMSGRPVYPKDEYWEQPGGVPANAFFAWTLNGTALLNVQEG